MLKVDRSNPSDLVWTGMEGRNGTSVPLDEEWVNANFEPWFLQNVFGAYKHIPGGKASSPKASVLEAGGRGSGRVPVVWQQGANQFCIPYGAASAADAEQFNDANGKPLAEHLAALAGVQVDDALMHLHNYVRASVPGWQARFLPLPHDPLSEVSDGLTVLQLEDTGGGVAHYVTAVPPSHLVFDANQPFAAQLSNAGLTSCCLAGAYKSVVRALRLEPGQKLRKAMRRASLQQMGSPAAKRAR